MGWGVGGWEEGRGLPNLAHIPRQPLFNGLLLLIPGFAVPHHHFRRLAPHPGDELLHLRMAPHGFRGGKLRTQLLVGEQGVELAVAGAVQVLRLRAPRDFG